MESMTFDFALSGKMFKGQRTVCGVVGSGNLEVIVEENTSTNACFEIETAIDHYAPVWRLVIENFVAEYQPVGLKFTLNDNGATPPVVSLRLRQAFEAFNGYQKTASNYLELDARERIRAITDNQSFTEWLADEEHYSPHLAALGLPGEGDDGIVIGAALFNNRQILIAAQQKDFMGGAVGEVHGAKLTGLFKAAAKRGVDAVILLIDSGGVRLHEANAGELAISETIRAIFEARNKGVMTIGVVCGKNGAFGGMGIISACLDYLIVNEIGRIGVSGADVIQAVKGVEAFDAQDRALVWRVYGGKTRYLQHVVQAYVGSSVETIKDALQKAMSKKQAISFDFIKEQHALLKKRFVATKGYEEEGGYLADKYPQLASTVFDMDEASFLRVAQQINKDEQ